LQPIPQRSKACRLGFALLLLATEKSAADVRGTVDVVLNGKPAEKLVLKRKTTTFSIVFKDVRFERCQHPTPSLCTFI